MRSADLNRPLTAKQQLFVDQLPLCNMNATEAYSKAYPNASPRSCATAASDLLADPRIKAAVEAHQAKQREQRAMEAGDVLHHIFQLATADPRELTEVWIGACRCCYGEGHLPQRTAAEFDRDWRAYLADKKNKHDPDGLAFPRQGGVGFRRKREPNPDCPECTGVGERYEVLKDTRLLSPAAARLYAGMKVGKDGAIEIKMRSQDKALELAGRTLGLFRDQVDVGGQRGPGAVPVAAVAFTASTPQDAAVLYQKLIGGGA